MMKRFLILLFSLGLYLLPSSHFGWGNGAGLLLAQQPLADRALQDLKQNTKFGGYIIGQATVKDQRGNDVKADGTLRLVRVSASGNVLDFGYMLQLQLNGTSTDKKGNEPRIVDAWVEWQRYDFLRVKFGQFKRAFTFENPAHPWNIGAGNYSQLTLRLAGFNDRVGEHSSNGRDFGLQLQGDFFPVGTDRHHLFHYQIGAYNGQGINRGDCNTRKDLIGGIAVRPIKDLQVGVFGWDGDFVKDGLKVSRTRWAIGALYDGCITAHAEYAHSVGRKISTNTAGTPVISGADRADAWYALVGVPITDKIKVWGKYDVYRDTREWDSARSLYILTADYNFHKNLKLQLNYTRVNDRLVNNTGGDGDYNQVDLQLYVRF